MKRHLFLIFSSIIFFLNSVSIIQAATADLDLSIAPSVVYLEVEPGKQKTYQLDIKHDGTNPLIVTPQVVEFTPQPDSGSPQLDMESHIPWVTINNESEAFEQNFKLMPHTTQRLTITVQPPVNLNQKEYHLTILLGAKAMNSPLSNQTSSLTSAIIGSNLIALVTNAQIGVGPVSVAQIKTKSIFDSLSPLKFSIIAKNDGLRAATITGSVKILDWTNQELLSFALPSQVILGESSRTLSYTPTASANASFTEFIYDQPFLFGPYSIEVKLDAINEQQPAVLLQKKVLALPIIIILITVLAIGCYSIVLLNRKKIVPLSTFVKTISLNIRK